MSTLTSTSRWSSLESGIATPSTMTMSWLGCSHSLSFRFHLLLSSEAFHTFSAPDFRGVASDPICIHRFICGGRGTDLQQQEICLLLLHGLHHHPCLLHDQHLRRLRDCHLPTGGGGTLCRLRSGQGKIEADKQGEMFPSIAERWVFLQCS